MSTAVDIENLTRYVLRADDKKKERLTSLLHLSPSAERNRRRTS